MQDIKQNEDTHFYIDNAPPDEVSHVLRVLSQDNPLTPDEIASTLTSLYGIQMQKDHSYSPRRLFDLGLAEQIREGAVKYHLTTLGYKVQSIQTMDECYARDLLHYRHYSSYGWKCADRKYLWSYRRCCELIWASGRLIPAVELAATIQSEMCALFPHLDFSARVGARFNGTAASCVSTWLRSLTPSPFADKGKELTPRITSRCELAVLGLDDVYRARQYTYGDPVILDDSLMNDVAGVFFLDRNCCADLLRSAADIYPCVKLADTLAGPSINLTAPFTVDDL